MHVQVDCCQIDHLVKITDGMKSAAQLKYANKGDCLDFDLRTGNNQIILKRIEDVSQRPMRMLCVSR